MWPFPFMAAGSKNSPLITLIQQILTDFFPGTRHASSLTNARRGDQNTRVKQFWIVMGCLLAYAAPAFACTCGHPLQEIRTRLAWAEAEINHTPVIFEGRVEKIELQGWPLKPEPGKTISISPESYGIRVKFSGAHLYRGEPNGDLVVATGLGMGDCGYPFEPGQSYLVYAWPEDSGGLATSICSGTRPLENAQTALRLLRGDPPTPGDLADPRNEETQPTASAEEGIKLCGKVSFPRATRPRSLKMMLWHADRDANPLPHDSVDSDDDGSFCFHDLDPGAYVLEAFEEADDNARYGCAGFFPGVKDRAQAKTLIVKQGRNAMRADFPVLRIPLYHIKGYLRGIPESDNDEVVVMIASDADPIPRSEPVHLDPHGTFELPAMPSGSYSVFAFRSADTNSGGASITFVSEVVHVDVQADVPGLKLQFVPKQ
jgi:hypothetical protein